MSNMLNSLLTPQQRAQADAADAAMRVIDGQRAIRAERATLNSAGQAIDAALRPCFDRNDGVYPGLCGDLRAEVDAEDDDPVRASDAAMEVAGRADRAFRAGNRDAAADLYRTAAQMLVVAAEVAEAL